MCILLNRRAPCVVVVVVQTRCKDEMFIHDAARDAPNYGGRVPGPVPEYRAQKNPPLTMSEHCNCGTTAVFCTPNYTAAVVAHNGHATTSPEFNRLQLWELGCLSTSARENCRTCKTAQQGHRPPCSATGNVHGQTNSLDHGDCLDGKMNDLWNSTTLSSNWGISMVCETMGSASA